MRSQRTNELLLRKRVSAFDSRHRIIEQANDNASGSEPCEIPTDGIKRQSAFNEQSAGIRMLSTSTARMTWRACAKLDFVNEANCDATRPVSKMRAKGCGAHVRHG